MIQKMIFKNNLDMLIMKIIQFIKMIKENKIILKDILKMFKKQLNKKIIIFNQQFYQLIYYGIKKL